MIRIGIIGSYTEKNNKEYVDFIVCKRIPSVNIIDRNKMQLCVNYVQVHVYFSVLVKLIQSLLLRQKSQLFRHCITSKCHTILKRLFFKMFFIKCLKFCKQFCGACVTQVSHTNEYIYQFFSLAYQFHEKHIFTVL